MLFKVISLIHSMKQPTLPILKCSPCLWFSSLFLNCRHFLKGHSFTFMGTISVVNIHKLHLQTWCLFWISNRSCYISKIFWFVTTVPTPILLSPKIEKKKKKNFFCSSSIFLSFSLCYKSIKNYSHWKIICDRLFPSHKLNYDTYSLLSERVNFSLSSWISVSFSWEVKWEWNSLSLFVANNDSRFLIVCLSLNSCFFNSSDSDFIFSNSIVTYKNKVRLLQYNFRLILKYYLESYTNTSCFILCTD